MEESLPKKLTPKKKGLPPELTNFVKNYSVYLIIGQVVVVLLIGYWFLLRPQIKIMRSQTISFTQESDTKENELLKLKEKITELDAMLSAYNDLSSIEQEKINATIADDLELEDIFAQLNTLVRVNGLILEAIDLKEGKSTSASSRSQRSTSSRAPVETIKTAPAGVEEADIELAVIGVTYPALKSLLASLENNSRFFDVQSMNYNIKGQSLSLIVKTYYLSK